CWLFVKLNGDVALVPLYENVVAPPAPVLDAVNVCWAWTSFKAGVALMPLYDNVVELFGLPVPCVSVITSCALMKLKGDVAFTPLYEKVVAPPALAMADT